MTKLLLLAIIVLIAFWLGKMSVTAKQKEISKRKSQNEKPVIDIEPEDRS